MKDNTQKTALLICLALVLVGVMFSGCGKSKSGGNPIATYDWYRDSDGDGFGDANATQNATEKPEGYVDNSSDCNDGNAEINPGAVELNDGIDNNCSGEPDEEGKKGVIPDTAQTASYLDAFGEDSDYIIDHPSYTKLDENGNALASDAASWKMVRDNVTGLIWEMKIASDNVMNYKNIHDPDNTYTWADASSVFIAKLNADNFGNFEDGNTWRLPTVRELAYITDCSKFPRLSEIYFPIFNGNAVWSSTSNVDPTTEAWTMAPYYGMPSTLTKTQKMAVWAVRGVEMVPKLEKFNKDIVVDQTTGLMWQIETGKSDNDDGMTYGEAVSYSENLELGGFKDWRLPSRNELLSIVRFDLSKVAADADYFKDMPAWGFWTSTTFIAPVSVGEYAWKIDFSNGKINYGQKSEKLWVKAVRGGNNTSLRKWYKDTDDDGFGDPSSFKMIDASVQDPEGYELNGTDCNDGNAKVYPGAEEVPDDKIDQNCTGKDLITWYQDSDDDDYGNANKKILSETQPVAYVANRFDCMDTNASVKPGQVEIPDDGLDNDCNGLASVSWYLDTDDDGYGDGPRVLVSESSPSDGFSYADNDLDCDDANAGIHPGLVEIFGNDSDSNCNGDDDDLEQQIVADTGQTLTSYSTAFGQDGHYLINPPDYVKVAADGSLLSGADSETEWVAVYDNVTGLMWEFKTLDNKDALMTYAAAKAYADGLTLAGKSDWRLPTVTELASIANLDKSDPAIDTAFFTNIVPYRYWTATDAGTDASYLTVSFQQGHSYVDSKTSTFRVMAVRGGRSFADRFIFNANGTVTDSETGLIWNDNLSTSGAWADSRNQWTGVADAGYSDWRLPTESDIDTLLAILDKDESFDFSLIFNNITIDGTFWTSTLSLTDPGQAIVFSLITGETDDRGLADVLRGLGVRGVRQTRFVMNEDKTVFDSRTGLLWMGENANDGTKMTFESAMSICESLTYAGYTDWRMPNRNEMISLLDAFLDDVDVFMTAFPDSLNVYWTSSSCFGQTSLGWQIGFKAAADAITTGPYTNENVFRAVRGGNPE